MLPPLRVRPLVRSGGAVPFELDGDRVRVGTARGAIFGGPAGSRRVGWGLAFWVVAQRADATVMTLGGDRRESFGRAWLNDGVESRTLSAAGQIDLPPGASTFVRYAVVAERGVANLPPFVRSLPAWPARSVPFEVAPPGEPTSAAVADPTMAESVKRGLKLERPFMWVNDRPERVIPLRVNGDHARLFFTLRRDGPAAWPLGVSWQVSLAAGGSEHVVGTLAWPPGDSEVGRAFGVDLPADWDLDWRVHDAVDVILRPSAEAAEETVEPFDYWDAEVRLPAVKLYNFDAEVRAAQGLPRDQDRSPAQRRPHIRSERATARPLASGPIVPYISGAPPPSPPGGGPSAE